MAKEPEGTGSIQYASVAQSPAPDARHVTLDQAPESRINNPSVSLRPSILSNPIFIELCAGSANLSFHAKAAGFQSIPIDHSRNEHKSKLPCICLDLAVPGQADVVLQLIASGEVFAISAGVPCGTASRAREIPIPGSNGGPPPLRSKEFPWGRPNLSAVNQLKVSKANDIYMNVGKIVSLANSKGVLVIIENPKNSYLWDIPIYDELLNHGFQDVLFQHCKWNPTDTPSRAKWTRLRGNFDSLTSIGGPCSVKHTHLKWGVLPDGTFATKQEAEYSDGMCQAIVGLLVTEARRKGIPLSPENLNPDIETSVPYKRRRAAINRQPRGKNLPSVTADFKEIVEVRNDELPTDPKSFKVLRTVNSNGGDSTDPTNLERSTSCILGKFRMPSEFLEAAKLAQHPADIHGAVPDELVRAILDLLSKPPHEFVKRLLHSTRELAKLVQDNKFEDDKVISNLHPALSRVLKDKKLFTHAQLAERIEYPDLELPTDIAQGFQLVGMQPFTHVFSHEVRLPTVSVGELRRISSVNNKAIRSRVASCGDPEVDKEAWELVQEEVNSGWLLGPVYTESDLSGLVDGFPHVSRRFPLRQTNKIRPIDDLSESSVNEAFGSHDKIQVHDSDTMCALVRLLERILHDGIASVPLRNGEVLPIHVYKTWLSDPSSKSWKGKNFDLSKAYKQLAVHPSQWWASAISTFDPHQQCPAEFCQVTLPFGASGAVLAFNRASTFLWTLGIKLLGVLWSNFYDDYACFAPLAISKAVKAAIELFFAILGWKLTTDHDKCLDFAASFSSLGIVFNVERLIVKRSEVSSKPSRIDAVVQQLTEIKEANRLSQPLADSVRGKVIFMELSIFGRAGRCVRPLFHRTGNSTGALNDKETSLIDWLCQWLRTAPPRPISSRFSGPPVLLFSDGACEYESSERIVTCGALLFDPRDQAIQFFGFKINQDLHDEWSSSGKRQLVTEAEILPQLVARRVWASRISGAHLLSFLDSEPAKHCCINANSNSEACEDLVRAIQWEDQKLLPWVWYTRVPTFSNPADAASRLDFELMQRTFPRATRIDADQVQPKSLNNGIWS